MTLIVETLHATSLQEQLITYTDAGYHKEHTGSKQTVTNPNGTMTLYKGKYRVETTRLRNWDYADAGWYFVTICTRDLGPFFGDVVEGETCLSPVGEIAHQYWAGIPDHFPNAGVDEWVIMPNHMHGIVVIEIRCRDVACNVSTTNTTPTLSRISPQPGSLATIIRSYKSAVTRRAREEGYSEFGWQSRFYDHIIRDEKSLHAIRRYIRDNPLKWEMDRDNPAKLYI